MAATGVKWFLLCVTYCFRGTRSVVQGVWVVFVVPDQLRHLHPHARNAFKRHQEHTSQ